MKEEIIIAGFGGQGVKPADETKVYQQQDEKKSKKLSLSQTGNKVD